jgi:hypothetical protein
MVEKCEQVNCPEDATRWYLWPGRGRMQSCLPHALKAKSIMGALGYPLQLNPIETKCVDESTKTGG